MAPPPVMNACLLVLLLLPGAVPPARGDDAIAPATQAAIDRGLKWLADHQNKEGTWETNLGPSSAVTSLAVMAFLARGHLPGQGEFGDKIELAIDFVVAHQMPGGMLSANNGTMYDHGISTIMLAEVEGIVDDARKAKVDAALGRAVKLILDAQRKTQGQFAGGWHYQPIQTDADISCSGWQLVALRGAANCGAAVPKDAIEKGVAYVQRCAYPAKDGGGFVYQPGGGPNRARTGTGILCLELAGPRTEKQPHLPEAVAGGDYLLKNLPQFGEEFTYYAAYYCSQAVNQLGGTYWDKVYPLQRDALLKHQRPDGAWPEGPGAEQPAGPAYATAMSVLALCVPYHYLPLYQK